MWEWFDSPMCLVASQLFPLIREELSDMRRKISAKDGLVEGCERELRNCHDIIAKMKEEIELCHGETESCMQEILKLRTERSAYVSELEQQKVKMSLYLWGCRFMIIALTLFCLYVWF